MQRTRELRLYEKLQGKQKKEKEVEQAEPPPESFLPCPDDGNLSKLFICFMPQIYFDN